MGLFSGEFIFGGAFYWKEFSVSKWVGLVNKNSLKHVENRLKQLSTNSPWAYIWEGLLSEGFLRLRFEGLILGGLIFWGGEGLIFGILRYIICQVSARLQLIEINDRGLFSLCG